MTPFDQAIALLARPEVKAKLATAEPDTAFVMGYMLAQVCGRCGDLLKYPDTVKPAETVEIKTTFLPPPRARRRK